MLIALMLCMPAFAATAAEARDPHIHFFNPHTGDLKAELADAKNAGEFVASGAFKTRKFAEFRQSRRKNGN